jgi:hypothetical protein
MRQSSTPEAVTAENPMTEATVPLLDGHMPSERRTDAAWNNRLAQLLDAQIQRRMTFALFAATKGSLDVSTWVI